MHPALRRCTTGSGHKLKNKRSQYKRSRSENVLLNTRLWHILCKIKKQYYF
jgi:hypothetical protein